MVLKFICHSKNTLEAAQKLGWLVGARYTHLRDVKTFANLEFLDIDWKNYTHSAHLVPSIVFLLRPLVLLLLSAISIFSSCSGDFFDNPSDYYL